MELKTQSKVESSSAADDDENAIADADKMTGAYLCKHGDPGNADYDPHALCEVDEDGDILRTVSEV